MNTDKHGLGQAQEQPQKAQKAQVNTDTARKEQAQKAKKLTKPLTQNIPVQLAALRQWVVWRLQERKGKATKVPYEAATGNFAKTTDPASWTTLSDAVAAMQRGNYSGIGLVFAPTDGLAGVDFDHVRNPESGELLPWAAELIATLGSYAEVSPSGTGVKVIGKAVKGEKWGRRARKAIILPRPEHFPGAGKMGGEPEIEVYDRGRYFTVTGEVICGQGELCDMQQGLDGIFAQYFGEEQGQVLEPQRRRGAEDGDVKGTNTNDIENQKTFGTAPLEGSSRKEGTPPAAGGNQNGTDTSARNGTSPEAGLPAGAPRYDATRRVGAGSSPDLSFDGRKAAMLRDIKARKLYEGNWQAFHYPSQSEADAAFCYKLAFYFAGDTGAMERVFRESGLYREKWEREDYRNGCLTRAAASCDDFYGKKGQGNEPQRRRGAEGGADKSINTNDFENRGSNGTAPLEGSSADSGNAPGGSPVLRNHWAEKWLDDKGKEQKSFYAIHMNEICAEAMAAVGEDIGRIGDNLFHAQTDALGRFGPVFMPDKNGLFGYLHQSVGEVRWKEGGLDAEGISFVSKAEFFSGFGAQATRYGGISAHPYFPPRPEIFTRWARPVGADIHDFPTKQPQSGGGNGDSLNRFVDFFNPATKVDGELLKAFVLTLFWGGEPGARPLFVICPEENGSQQSIGKTTLATLCASLVGGAMDLELPRRASFGDGLAKQALEEVNLPYRVAIIDNHTGVVRDDSFTKIITAGKLAGRAAYSKQAERANLITWVMTSNEPNFSTDIATRVAMIRLKPVDRKADPLWLERVQKFLKDNADAITLDAEAALMAKNKKPIDAHHSRFTAWDREVVGCCDNPHMVLEYMQYNQDKSDTDADEIMEFIDEMVTQWGTVPHQSKELKIADIAKVWNDCHQRDLSPQQVATILKNAMARGVMVGSDGGPLLEHKKKTGVMRWIWHGWRAGREGQLTITN